MVKKDLMFLASHLMTIRFEKRPVKEIISQDLSLEKKKVKFRRKGKKGCIMGFHMFSNNFIQEDKYAHSKEEAEQPMSCNCGSNFLMSYFFPVCHS